MTNHTKQTFQIVASDLDGTLLAPDHKLSKVSKAALAKLAQQGLTFIFATGRHHVDVASIRQSTGISAYMITSNGARVHDQDDQLIYSQNIDQALVQPIIDIIKQDPKIRINIYQDDSWLINQEDQFLKSYHQDSKFPYQIFDVDNAPTSGIAKLFFVYPDHEYLSEFEDAINQAYAGQITAVFSTPFCLEVMAAGVSKGLALQAIAESQQLSLQDCIAFGDGMNDVEMLSMAGKGLVMQTAHDKVKQALPDHEVIGSNADNAVAHYLTKHLLK